MRKRLQRSLTAGLSAGFLLVGTLGQTAAWAATEPNPEPTPGFPLAGKYDYPDDKSDIRDSTPTPYTVINYGGIPTKSPNFVNVGDSHTATAWIPTTIPEPCLHNALGFAQVVGQKTGLDVRDASCAGAGIEHYWHTKPTYLGDIPKAAQRLAINKNTKLVVASLGGNDTYEDAMAVVVAKCTDYWKKKQACATYLRPQMMSRAEALSPAMYYMLKDIKMRAAKDAVVIGMGYYSPMPRNYKGCWADGLLPAGDLKLIHDYVVELNHQMQMAAKKAGVIFYNPSQYITFKTSGCGTAQDRLITMTGFPEVNTPIHPTLRGQWLSADTVVKLYNQELAARKAGTSIAPATWTVSYDTKS